MPKKSRFDPTNVKARLREYAGLPLPEDPFTLGYNRLRNLAASKLKGMNWSLNDFDRTIELEPMYPENISISQTAANTPDVDYESMRSKYRMPPLTDVPLEFLARVPEAGNLLSNIFPRCYLTSPMLVAAHLPNPDSTLHKFLQKRFQRYSYPELPEEFAKYGILESMESPRAPDVPNKFTMERVQDLLAVFGPGAAQLIVTFNRITPDDVLEPYSEDGLILVKIAVLPISKKSLSEAGVLDDLIGENFGIVYNTHPPLPVSRVYDDVVRLSETNLRVTKNFAKYLEDRTFTYWSWSPEVVGNLVFDFHEAVTKNILGKGLLEEFIKVYTYMGQAVGAVEAEYLSRVSMTTPSGQMVYFPGRGTGKSRLQQLVLHSINNGASLTFTLNPQATRTFLPLTS